MRVLVTGGAGYIGSHTLLELLDLGHEVCVVDSYANSSPEVLNRVRALSNGRFDAHQLDIRDQPALDAVFAAFRPETVIHFAGLKAVGESQEKPLEYYDVNVFGTLTLLRAMDRAGCGRILFSSSATVYGVPQYLPYDEAHRCLPGNVYGRTKHMAEQILTDWQQARPASSAVLLRYFNPVGAHGSGRIGEDPRGVPNNLMPFVAQVAAGLRPKVAVFGKDYDTIDGTGSRDYLHVVDLARAHGVAVEYGARTHGTEIFNIGTGTGYTVLQMIAAFARVCGRDIPYEVVARRPGDVAAMLADPARANRVLGWSAKLGLDAMCQSAWRWQVGNPNGYGLR